MPLPIPALPAGTIELAGERIEYHSLSRSQALQLNSYQGREDEAEDFMLACGLNPAPLDPDQLAAAMAEAHAWREAVTVEVGGELVDAIIDISGLSDQVKGNGADPKSRRR